MRLDFGGRVALVTGGASGLGRAAAARLVRDNARAIILDRDEDALADAAAELGAVPVALDVTEKAGWIGAVERIEADHGPIAVLVTAAGVLEPPRPPERITEQAWDKTFAVNFEGTRLGCQIVGARMAARGAGSIVTVASIVAFEPGPLVIYGPAKAAVVALTQALAGAWGRRGVRINAVAPGYVRTPALERGLAFGFVDEARLAASTALGRLTTADEVADAIAFLASDAAAAIIGVVLPVDAGHLLAGGWTPHGGFPT
ncbi:MAG TPA: SDR family oxidoreductase [Beijerinckiaceae bacterium]|nr:SDR family oxidoreductase [Beijerinckiaceae bacterium]